MSRSTQPRDFTSKPKTLLTFPEDAQQQAYHASDVFPRPREIEPQVKFWQKVYATWSQSQVAIHDKLHMNVVYEVVRLPGEVSDGLTSSQKEFIQARLDDWERRLGDVESKLAAGAALSAEDQGLVQQMEQITGDRKAVYGASQRLRQQRGLRERFKKGLVIGSRYDRKYRDIFRNAGLPEDLAFLPHVESSFQFNAHSSAGALGVWQFTAGAARTFMNDASAAARLDPIASTHGAARYLSHAYQKLGSWPLAVTSYNHGIGGMQRAKDRFGHDFPRIVKEYDSPIFGFASRNYYAEFLAARDIASKPERFFPEGLNTEAGIGWAKNDSPSTTSSPVPRLKSAPLYVASAEPAKTPYVVPTAFAPKPLTLSSKAKNAARAEPKRATYPQALHHTSVPQNATKSQPRATPVYYRPKHSPEPVTKSLPKQH